MKLKSLVPLLCLLIAIPGLSVATEKTVYGLNEYACINDPDIQLAAEFDTGAKTASLSARGIKRFRRDGETWVRFYLATDNADDTSIEKSLTRISKIERRHGDLSPDEGKAYIARPVIKLQVCMSKAIRTIEVSLIDRSAFQCPLLIGLEALKKFDALINPSLKYSTGKPGYKPDAKPAE